MMKIFATLIAASAALFAGTAAHAQPSAGTQEKLVVVPSMRVEAQDSYRMTPDELREFQGQYLLEDGTTLTVSRRSRRLFSAVTGRPEVELVATSPNSFVTRTGATKVAFRQAANGNVFGVELRQGGGMVAQ